MAKNNKLFKIKDIVNKHYRYLLISYLGKDTVTEAEYKSLKNRFPNMKPNDVIKQVYGFNHGQIRDLKTVKNPPLKNLAEAVVPKDKVSSASINFLRENFEELLEKQKNVVEDKFREILQEENVQKRFNEISEALFDEEKWEKERVKKIKEITGVTNRDWDRVVATEVSNGIGHASMDFIAKDNEGGDFKQVYVYKINPDDGRTCAECRRFYIDSDGSPKLYRFSTLVSNGTNYGKKRASWKPVGAATHPNDRCSQMLQLKPGFILKSSGYVDILPEKDPKRPKWTKYIKGKLKG